MPQEAFRFLLQQQAIQVHIYPIIFLDKLKKRGLPSLPGFKCACTHHSWSTSQHTCYRLTCKKLRIIVLRLFPLSSEGWKKKVTSKCWGETQITENASQDASGNRYVTRAERLKDSNILCDKLPGTTSFDGLVNRLVETLEYTSVSAKQRHKSRVP